MYGLPSSKQNLKGNKRRSHIGSQREVWEWNVLRVIGGFRPTRGAGPDIQWYCTQSLLVDFVIVHCYTAMDAWKSDLVKVVSYLGVLPLDSEPSQEQIKKLSLPSFGQAVLALPKSATEGANVQREESTHALKADSNVGDGLPFILSEALPVVPPKLVKRIIKGEYVDMAELLNDNMEAERQRALIESEISPYVSQHRPGCREVLDILSWLHCFSLYAIVVCCSHPTKAKQLWTYQAMMINEA